MAPLVSPKKCNLAFTLLSVWNVSMLEETLAPLPPRKYAAGRNLCTYEDKHFYPCMHMAQTFNPPALTSIPLQIMLGRTCVSLKDGILR